MLLMIIEPSECSNRKDKLKAAGVQLYKKEHLNKESSEEREREESSAGTVFRRKASHPSFSRSGSIHHMGGGGRPHSHFSMPHQSSIRDISPSISLI